MVRSKIIARTLTGPAARRDARIHGNVDIIPRSNSVAARRTSPRPNSLHTEVRPAGPSAALDPSILFNPSWQKKNTGPVIAPDETDANHVKLGQTISILQDRLPTLLQRPLPKEILAPNIALRLFPSTHPHLPVVSGRMAYIAALWTSPIAWNRIPLISNVRIDIMSQRVTKEASSHVDCQPGAIEHHMFVRWRTACDHDGWDISKLVGSVLPPQAADCEKKEFTGLFIFEFDKHGRILSHIIENVNDCQQHEKVSKVVGLTDWIIGRIKTPTPPDGALTAAIRQPEPAAISCRIRATLSKRQKINQH